MTPEQLQVLLQKYQDGLCDEQEQLLVERFLTSQYHLTKDREKSESEYTQVDKQIWNSINSKGKTSYLYIAASIAFLLSITAVFYYFKHQGVNEQQLVTDEVRPGSNNAILKLASGKTIDLKKLQKGGSIEDGGILICKNANGQITYAYQNQPIGQPTIHQVITPNGGRFKVQLPDGTVVLVNSGSTIKYPTAFTGGQRRVELSGEAYFEVRKDPRHPFIVTSGGQQVKVLGTEFNIHAYAGSALVTTLVSGSVQLLGAGKVPQLLTPGQQAEWKENQNHFEVRKADVVAAIAWKNGEFAFRDVGLNEILPLLERWYDVKFEYQQLPKERFFFAVEMDVPLSKVLSMLEYTSESGIKFSIQGRRVAIR